MAYDCACGYQGACPKDIVRHMADKHNSFFTVGDPVLVRISRTLALNEKNENGLAAFARFGDEECEAALIQLRLDNAKEGAI